MEKRTTRKIEKWKEGKTWKRVPCASQSPPSLRVPPFPASSSATGWPWKCGSQCGAVSAGGTLRQLKAQRDGSRASYGQARCKLECGLMLDETWQMRSALVEQLSRFSLRRVLDVLTHRVIKNRHGSHQHPVSAQHGEKKDKHARDSRFSGGVWNGFLRGKSNGVDIWLSLL